MAVKGLNHTEGYNRFRFENLSERLQNVNVDIIHRSSHHGTLDIKNLPETGVHGCYFQDELENLKELYLTSTFKRFFYAVWPLVQSLPELLFNLDKIADMLKKQLSTSSIDDLPAYLQLISVLSRDSQDDFFRHFHSFFQLLTDTVQNLAAGESIDGKKTNGPNPELIGKVFECMSFLIRYQTSTLVQDYDGLRKYYGPLLGNRTTYVREFSSQMFTIILRKLSTKEFRYHLKNVFRAVAVSCANKHVTQKLLEGGANSVLDLPITPIEGDSGCLEDVSIRAQDLLEGVTLLIYSVSKGIKNCLHSKGSEMVAGALSLISPMTVQLAEEITNLATAIPREKSQPSTGIVLASALSDIHQKNIMRVTMVDAFRYYCSGRIVTDVIGRLFRHCHPANMFDLWIVILEHLEKMKKSLESFLLLSEPSLELAVTVEISLSFTVEIFNFALCHSNHRALGNITSLYERIILTIHHFAQILLGSALIDRSAVKIHRTVFSKRLLSRTRTLCTSLWLSFHSHSMFVGLKSEVIQIVLGMPLNQISFDQCNKAEILLPGLQTVLDELFPLLQFDEVCSLLTPVFKALVALATLNEKDWVKLLYEVLIHLADNREPTSDLTSKVASHYENLQTCLPEFQSLLRSCLSISHNSVSELMPCKTQILYAWRCLSWATNFEPSICLQLDTHHELQTLGESLMTTIIPTLLKEACVTHSHHSLLAVAIDTGCNICNLFLGSQQDTLVSTGEVFKTKMIDQVLIKLINLVGTLSPSLMLLWCFRRLLNLIVCPLPELLGGDESQRHYLISHLTQKQQENLFHALSYGLLNPSYWIRRESLHILLYFPPPAVIKNKVHRDAGDERDLDDEIELSERIVFDVVKLCYEAASMQVSFKNEREFSRRMAQLEVFINSSSLPTEYSRIISAFCLGILFVKFQPLWSSAVTVLTSAVLSEESEPVTWPLILHVLNNLGQRNESYSSPSFDNSRDDPFNYFETIDSGEYPIEKSFSESPHFLYSILKTNDDASIVQSDSRTDIHTAYDTVWDVFQKCPSITLRHSKVVVPMFITFLKNQYYRIFYDDPELPTISFSGLFDIPEISQVATIPDLSITVVKKRLILFLKVFAAVTSPKQLYHHQALYKFYSTILSKPDTTVAKIALDCLLTYKPPSIIPYQKSLKNFFDDSVMRNELLIFDPSLSASTQIVEGVGRIELDHRPTLVPVIIRILYGRFVSKAKGGKSAREQGIARRNAVLSFLAMLPENELSTLIHLMVRGLVSNHKLLTFIENHQIKQSDYLSENWLFNWHSTLIEILQNHICKDDYLKIPYDRQIGFLFLLEQCIKILGFNLTPNVPILIRVLTSMLSSTLSLPDDTPEQQDSDDGENFVDTTDDKTFEQISHLSQIRTMCFRRLSEIDQYEAVVDFSYLLKDLWIDLNGLIESLPGTISGSISGGTRAPALLKLVTSLVAHETTINVIASREEIVTVLIRCIGSQRVAFASLKLVMTSLLAILEFRDGIALSPHIELLIDSFSQRFLDIDPSDLDSEVKLSELKINPIGSVREELHLLTSIATKLFSRSDLVVQPKRIANLATLLLGMLRTYTNSKKVSIGEDWANNILIIYRTLLPRVQDVRPHVSFISRLFGPTSFSQSVFNLASVRSTLVSVFLELSNHPSTSGLLEPSYIGIKKLTTFDRKSISTRDFGECMPVFQSLSDESSPTAEFPFTWDMIVGPSRCSSLFETSLVHVLVHECLRCMYDSEVAVRGSALASLKTLISMTAKWSGLIPSSCSPTSSDIWLELVRTIVLPGMHRGIKMSIDTVKKGFVLLLNHLVKVISKYCHPKDQETFHADLLFLVHDDPDQDFFESIVHIQVHRRSRAFLKLRGQLAVHQVTTRSFTHVLLPLALFPIFSGEFSKKEHAVLLQESSTLIGTISSYLNWSPYLSLLKLLLKHLRHNLDKEKILLTTICSILDSFHFELSNSNEVEKTMEEQDENESDQEMTEADPNETPQVDDSKKVVIIDSVLKFIFPQVKSFLIKHGKDHTGNKTQTVRPLIAVALVKLLKRCEPPVLSHEQRNSIFINLVLSVVNTLRSKDSSARDMARDSLAKMIITMGLDSLKLVLAELDHGLREGYQRHVRNYTVRALLTSVLENYVPPSDVPSILEVTDNDKIAVSENIVSIPSFDECIPLITKFCLDEIAGLSYEDKNVEGVQRTLIREAKGNKANEIFELCGRCLLFRPSTALSNPQLSSVHFLITPLLELLKHPQGSDISSTNLIGRTNEALLRASVGLSKNPSLNAPELFLFLHSTLTPFVAALLKDFKLKKPADEEHDDEVLSSYIPSYLRDDSSDEEDGALYSKKQRTKLQSTTKANIWLPADRNVNVGQREAITKRNEERRELLSVQDGASAPKLTGRNRYKRKLVKDGNALEDDPAFMAAVKFCLSLLLACLKQKRFDEKDEVVRSMATPFLPLFAQCLRISGNSGLVVLAMRCICSLLCWGLFVDAAFSRSVGKRMLGLMFKGGAVLSTDNDLVQTCVKGLSSLFMLYNNSKKDAETFNPFNTSVDESEIINSKKVNEKLPLDIDSIRTLLSLLTSSILEVSSTYQNSAFQLIKAIVESKIVVPEMYDLMKALIEQVVLSHRKGVRDVAISVVLSFLLTYPMGKKRLEGHIKQFISNCSYEFEEGRMAALNLIHELCRALPVEVLDEYTLLIYLPMTIQVVNDNSAACRSRAGDIITNLVRRCSVNMATQCWNYAMQWLGVVNDDDLFAISQIRCTDASLRPLMRTGAQVASLLVIGRHDIVKRATTKNILIIICAALTKFAYVENSTEEDLKSSTLSEVENEGDGCGGGLEVWALIYHMLILMEKLTSQLPLVIEKSINSIQNDHLTSRTVLELIEESLLYPHAWVRAVSCRIIYWYLQRRDPVAINFGTPGFVDVDPLQMPNSLYNLARRLCLVLNSTFILPSLLPPLINCLVFVIRAMYYHPDLVSTKIDDAELIDEENLPSEEVVASNWAVQRLRAIGADSRNNKRFNVLQVFLELVRVESSAFVTSHLPQFIEVCMRRKRDNSDGPALLEASAQLLHNLESKVGASTFIGAYSEVQTRMEKYKMERKRKAAAEAIQDPRAFALKKVEISKKKQESKKRKSEKYAVLNGSKRKSKSLAVLYAEK